jgi:hypothetical protein
LITILGIVQGISSGVLIGFYIINKFDIVVKAKWREFIKQNKLIYSFPENPERLSVEEMSLE